MSPNAGGGGYCGVSANKYSCVHGVQTNFGDLTPYLTNDLEEMFYSYTMVSAGFSTVQPTKLKL
jgi:hypothetical protein